MDSSNNLVHDDDTDNASFIASDHEIDLSDKLLPLIELKKDDVNGTISFDFCQESFDQATQAVEHLPLSTICLYGEPNQGLSNLLKYVDRGLRNLEVGNEAQSTKCNSILPHNPRFQDVININSDSQGMWVWSRPFLLKNRDEKETAVLLIVANNVNISRRVSNSVLKNLTILISSVTVINLFETFDSNIFTFCGKYANRHKPNPRPFQRLYFLIQEWNESQKYAYGKKGGEMLLEELQNAEHVPTGETKAQIQSIQSFFGDFQCFYLPKMGDDNISSPGLNNTHKEASSTYEAEIDKFMACCIGKDALVRQDPRLDFSLPKIFKSQLIGYLDMLNSNSINSENTFWESTVAYFDKQSTTGAYQKFKDVIDGMVEGKPVGIEFLENILVEAKNQALELFEQSRAFKSVNTSDKAKEEIIARINQTSAEIRSENEDRRTAFLTTEINNAATQFRETLEKNVPLNFSETLSFYEDNEILQISDPLKNSVIEVFKQTLQKEPNQILLKKVESLESILESIIESRMKKNKLFQDEASKTMSTITSKIIDEYKSELTNSLKGNYSSEDNQRKQIYKKILASKLEDWSQTKKPGSQIFQLCWTTNLKKDMKRIYSDLENEYLYEIQQYKTRAANLIQDLSKNYKRQIQKDAKSIKLENETNWITKNQPLLLAFTEKFKNSGPSTSFSQLQELFEEKLLKELQSIFKETLELQREEHFRKLVAHGQSNYTWLMREFFKKHDFISESTLQSEHENVSKEMLNIFDNFKKWNAPANGILYKRQLQESLETFYDMFIEENKTKYENALSNAKISVNDSHTQYQNIMKNNMDKIKTDSELEACHQDAIEQSFLLFERHCPGIGDADFVELYKNELHMDILNAYEEFKDFLEMKRQLEDVDIRGILADCQKFYQDEMQQHCNNAQFIRPEVLSRLHTQAKEVVIEKCSEQIALSGYQKTELEDIMDSLFVKINEINNMKLNFVKEVNAPAIGIDLGTTYCCVAVCINGSVKIIPNHDQGNLETTASYVAFNADGTTTTGAAAKKNAYKNPLTTIHDVKRIIGRKFDDVDLQKDINYWRFTVEGTDNIPKIKVRETLYHPEQISAILLQDLTRMAEKHLTLPEGTIKKAVITVPAYFTDGQRQATIDAGEIAGLEVLTILNEPTAAAIAYSMEKFDSSARKVLIFDLGGGTFDVSVLEATPQKIEVLGVDGNTNLGGEDFDQNLMSYCACQFQKETKIDLLKMQFSTNKNEQYDAKRALTRLKMNCESEKQVLAVARTTTITIDAIYNGKDLSVEVTRETFEKLNDDLFKETIRIVDKALQNVGVKKESVDDVVLVGGSTRIPKVQEMLSNYFNGKVLNRSIHADLAIAYGAAIKAAILNGEQAKGKLNLEGIQDVTPMSLGIRVYPRNFSIVIPKYTKVPVKITRGDYMTVSDNQTRVEIIIYQGEASIAAENELLGEFTLKDLPKAKVGKEKIDVCMEIDVMGILHVQATCVSTGKSKKITVLENKKRLSSETKRRLTMRNSD